MTNNNQKHQTNFYYTFQTAHSMGFGTPDSYKRLEDFSQYITPWGTQDGEESFHALACSEENVSIAWFEQPLWAFAMRNRLRELGVGAVVAYDEGPGWAPDKHGFASAPYVVLYRGDSFNELKNQANFQELAQSTSELALTLEEANSFWHTSTGQTDPVTIYTFDDRLHATIFRNVMHAAQKRAQLIASEFDLGTGHKIHHEVLVSTEDLAKN